MAEFEKIREPIFALDLVENDRFNLQDRMTWTHSRFLPLSLTSRLALSLMSIAAQERAVNFLKIYMPLAILWAGSMGLSSVVVLVLR